MKDFTGFADETRDNDRSLKPSQRGTIAKEPVPAGTQSGAAMARYEHESTEVPLRAQDSLHAQITNKRFDAPGAVRVIPLSTRNSKRR